MSQKATTTGQKWFSYLLVLFAATGGILYGYDLGIISGAFLFIPQQIPMSTAQSSFLVGAVLGGGAIATLISGSLSEIFGRKTMIQIAAIIFLAGIAAIYVADNYAWVLFGRLTQGVGVGIVTIVIPLYLAESLPAEIRGRGIGAFQLLLTSGILLANLVGLYYTPSGNWRAMFLTAAVPGLLLLVGACFLPKSPRWLFKKGRSEKAMQILRRSRSQDSAQAEIQSIAKLQSNQPHWRETFSHFKQKAVLIPVLMVFAIAALQQLLGINSILQFGAYILKTAGLGSDQSAMLGSSTISIVNFLTTIVAFILVDRIGRRALLMFGTLGCMLSLFALGCADFIFHPSAIKGDFVLVGLITFIICYAVGPGLVIWLVISELLPCSVRSIGMSMALFINSMVSTLFASAFLPLVNHIGYSGVFLLCSLSAGLYFLIAFNWLPETNKKTLEEIELSFQTSGQNG